MNKIHKITFHSTKMGLLALNSTSSRPNNVHLPISTPQKMVKRHVEQFKSSWIQSYQHSNSKMLLTTILMVKIITFTLTNQTSRSKEPPTTILMVTVSSSTGITNSVNSTIQVSITVAIHMLLTALKEALS